MWTGPAPAKRDRELYSKDKTVEGFLVMFSFLTMVRNVDVLLNAIEDQSSLTVVANAVQRTS